MRTARLDALARWRRPSADRNGSETNLNKAAVAGRKATIAADVQFSFSFAFSKESSHKSESQQILKKT